MGAIESAGCMERDGHDTPTLVRWGERYVGYSPACFAHGDGRERFAQAPEMWDVVDPKTGERSPAGSESIIWIDTVLGACGKMLVDHSNPRQHRLAYRVESTGLALAPRERRPRLDQPFVP